MKNNPEENTLFALLDLNHQARFFLKRNIGMKGLLRASILNFNDHDFDTELNDFHEWYLIVLSTVNEVILKKSKEAVKEYVRKKVIDFPELDPDDYMPPRYSKILLGVSIVFFPVFFILIFRSIKKMLELNSKLHEIVIVSNSIANALKKPNWAEVLTKKEILN